MKIKKLIFTMIVGLLAISCSLNEDPPFLSNESAFATLDNAQSTLDGVYSSLSGYDYLAFRYHYVINGNSGLFVSGKGNSNKHNDNLTMCSLMPQSNAVDIENLWREIYRSIGRANVVIASVEEVDSPAMPDEFGYNDVLGEAYFIRAYSYFNLVRLWGDIPLRLEPTNMDNVHLGKTNAKDVYSQIIKDADMAKKLMFTQVDQRPGYPANLAASMLKAKVYMHLATAAVELQDSGINYWTSAYDEAKEVYGNYSLVANYATLWTAEGGNNTSESIFDVQFNDIQSSNFARLWTANKATFGATWGRIKMNPENYDLHEAKYPGDQRIAETFISEYVKTNNGSTTKTYPSRTRTSFANGYPFGYKYWMKDASNTTGVSNKNYIAYRYADLLLMLAEISNELQNGEETGYLSEVLSRVGLTPHADYANGQDEFRNAIMREYRFELLGEGQDWFNNRRRGYQFFKTNIIELHNNAPTFKANVDVVLLDNDESVMHLPIPASEINTNEEINN